MGPVDATYQMQKPPARTVRCHLSDAKTKQQRRMYNPVESLTSPPCSELLMMNQNHNEKTVVAAVVKRRKTTTAGKGMVPAALTKNRPKFGLGCSTRRRFSCAVHSQQGCLDPRVCAADAPLVEPSHHCSLPPPSTLRSARRRRRRSSATSPIN